MDPLEVRRDAIRNMWKTTTLSGVDVYPLAAAVAEMANRGFAMSTARRLLARAEEEYRLNHWDKLLVTVALINKEIHAALESGARGVTLYQEYLDELHDPAMFEPRALSPEEYMDRVKGAWIGKCIGVALGDPLEGWSAEMIRKRYGWITDYVARPSITNDDTAYQVLVLHALDEHGPSFSSEALALEWVEHLPHAFTAEWVALENIKAGLMPPESGWFRNPYAEWVGAQMRSEIFGLLAPMRPDLAAPMAFRDAIISHRGEGVFGSVFCAVLVSAAFSGRPVEDLLSFALSWVPARSRFRQLVEATMAWCAELRQFDAVLHRIEREVARYHWIHTLPNIAAVVTGLCLGEGDFERSLLSTLHCGFDTDCSTGQTAALLGTLVGCRHIPQRWREPIGDSFQSYVIGFETMSFDELAAWTVRCGQRVLESGGRTQGCPGGALGRRLGTPQGDDAG